MLVFVMILVCCVVGVTTIGVLYRAEFDEVRNRLVETAQSQAQLIRAIARFDSQYSNDYPGGARAATLSQIVEAHKNYESLGRSIEFLIAQRDAGSIVFLLDHRHEKLLGRKSVPFASKFVEPMRRALTGESGAMVFQDIRGVEVLAAYEPVAELGLAIVARIDLVEVRAPFIRAGLISGVIGFFVIIIGAGFFVKVTDPLLKKLTETIAGLQEAMSKVKTLSGFLPICASCKKIRDDQGYWNQIEVYIRNHSEAEFSHGICPDCAKKLYPGINLDQKPSD